MKTAALPAHVPVEENCQSKHGALPLMEIRCGSNAAGGGECAQLLPVPDSLLVPITERENGLVKYEGGEAGTRWSARRPKLQHGGDGPVHPNAHHAPHG
jgi:hypothetical protein